MARKNQQTGLRTLIAALCLLLCCSAHAEELEYKMDMGAGVGGCFYLGDANSTPFAGLSMMGGLMARRNFNPRMSLKTNLAIGHIHGTTNGIYIPTDAYSKTPEGGTPTEVRFSRNVLDLGAQFELNFWGYGTGAGYKGNSPITPYILAGAGLTIGMGGHAPATAGLNIPLGIGVKYKVRPRMNIGFEWSIRFTTTDKLDATAEGTQLTDPYGVESAMFKNKDCYSFAQFFLTYDMFPKYRKCNN